MIDSYTDWTEHRYDPGHYLGGRIEPDLRKSSLGPRARRRSGMILIGGGLLGLATVRVWAHLSQQMPGDLATKLVLVLPTIVSALSLAAGVAMVRSASREEPVSRTRRK